ncbi:mitogen-activated protein kinase SMK1 NDAI_0A05280 [Naumovozyma dairenensis CBS 421]|uniref:Protein kinase domain-containing protein n=1 Tax=Naumovozyma dairenensis (strain ATCC 10597 / BCRC 20456 / CBS 421 / NBRC 0211 / NRRL Y-12639) TaxID=1071378 RepID=G0W4E5_NAUDC|nr:hypothetical protein NDAI_0A05280 [Naumovozyma dairenensis CBS 421]CCD22683.1 hypothetical protein NDAI_0A05280 [Naumovozyma dairenensis CBS 421]
MFSRLLYGNNQQDASISSKNSPPPSSSESSTNLMFPTNNRTIYDPAKFSVPKRYQITQMLGKGSYGIVCSAKDTLNSSSNYSIAIKKIINIYSREILLKRAIRELKFMIFLKGHKNIISLIDLEIINDNLQYDGLYCYQELIDHDLTKVIHSSAILTDFHIKYFIYQIICGIKYIHSADIIHRDLKPGNILVTWYGNLKICDFGLARGINPKFRRNQESNNIQRQPLTNSQTQSQSTFKPSNNNADNDITNYVATRWYRAPELLLSRKEYTKAIDMWAIGCILAELYGRTPIFRGINQQHQIYEIIKVLGPPSNKTLIKFDSLTSWQLFNGSGKTMKKPTKFNSKIDWKLKYSNITTDAISFLETLLTWDPDDRFNAEEAINHSFLMDVRKPHDEPDCPHGPFDYSYEYELNSMNALREYLQKEVWNFRKERSLQP